MLYHKIVLEGYLLMACMIRVQFGSLKAEKLIDTWISGYNIPAFKQVIEDNLKSVLDIADSAVSVHQCRHWVVMATRYNEFHVPSLTNIQIVTDYLTDKLSIGGGSLAKVGPYSGSIIMRCLQTKLGKEEKERMSMLVGAGQQFTYQLIGAAMTRILGHHSSADLLRILAHELNRAGNLEREEVRKRVRFLVSGFKLSEICRKVRSDQDCLEAVEADFSAHTPAGEHLKPLHLLLAHPPLAHPALSHPVLGHPALSHPPHNASVGNPLLEDIIKQQPDLAPLKPKKPSPGKVGGNPLTHKQGQQSKIGAAHPGISVSTQNDHTALLEHALNHHITEDWPLDVHPEQLTTSADELVNKVKDMENPLITAIMENKNPELLKLLQDSGSPELLQTLLNSPVPITNENTPKLGGPEMSKKERARLRLKQLLYAFKGNKQRLAKAIKARAKLRLLSYLRNHKNSKLLSMMKMKYKEPLMAELGFQQEPQSKMQSINFKAKAKVKAVTAHELLKLLELKHGAHHTKFHPSELKPGTEILDELKEELGTLGFKHKKKPAEYVDNTLVHFGNQAFAGVGLPIDENAGDVIDSMNRKHHHNPFQYEEDWKGSMWSSKKHNSEENPQHSYNGEHHYTNEMPVESSQHLNFGGESEMMGNGQHVNEVTAFHNAPSLTSIDDSAATFGGFTEDNPSRENLKNVLKAVATNGMDSNDVESLMSNLPGIIGHQVNRQEVNNILAQFGKKVGQQLNSVKVPVINEQTSNGQQFISQQAAENEGLPAQNQAPQELPPGGLEALQKQIQPQRIVEQVELSSSEQAHDKGTLSNGLVPAGMSPLNQGAVDLPSMENGQVSFEKEGQERVIHIRPNQNEIHVNSFNMQGKGGSMDADQLEREPVNYAGVTENDKPKVDLLNLNGKIQGIEGLDGESDGGKTVENLLSSDQAATSQADQEAANELKEQEEFDSNALKTVHRLTSVKPTTINTNYLESFDNDDITGAQPFSSRLSNKPTAIDTNYLDSIDRPLSTRLSNKPTDINANYLESFDNDDNALKKSDTNHDVVDDYMSYIHKEDAVDEAYAKHYYKNSNNPLAATSGAMFESDVNFGNFEKKSLKSKSKKGKKHEKKKQDLKKKALAKTQQLKSDKQQALNMNGRKNVKGQNNLKPKAGAMKNGLRPIQKTQNVQVMAGAQQEKAKVKKRQKQKVQKLKKKPKQIPVVNLKKKVIKTKQGFLNKIVENTNQWNSNEHFQKQKVKVDAKQKTMQTKQKQGMKPKKNVRKQKKKNQRKDMDKSMNIL